MIITQSEPASALSVAGFTGSNVMASFSIASGEPGAGNTLYLPLPGSNRLNGKMFKVQAAGNITLNAGTYTATVLPVVYGSTVSNFTPALSNFMAEGGGALTISSAAAVPVSFAIDSWWIGDNVSGLLVAETIVGVVSAPNNGGALAAIAVTPGIYNSGTNNPLQNVNFNSEPPAYLAAGFRMSNIPNGYSANLTQFSVADV